MLADGVDANAMFAQLQNNNMSPQDKLMFCRGVLQIEYTPEDHKTWETLVITTADLTGENLSKIIKSSAFNSVKHAYALHDVATACENKHRYWQALACYRMVLFVHHVAGF